MTKKFIVTTILLLISSVSLADELKLEYWKEQYSYCISNSPIVLIGGITGLSPLKFNDGGKGYGYTQFEVSVKTITSIKNVTPKNFTYKVWLEGKEGEVPKLQGEAFLSLEKSPQGDFIDPEGFGRLPINRQLKQYAISLSATAVNK